MTVELQTTIAILLTMLMLVIILFIYSVILSREPIERKENLLGLFMATQNLALSVRRDLMNYALGRNKMKAMYEEGVTFEEYINQMKISYRKELSDDIYRELYNTRLTSRKISKLEKELRLQIFGLQELETKLKTWQNIAREA